jgi:membrane peptidoglycan carboxypeptidase
MVEVGSLGAERALRLQARPLGLTEEAQVRSAAPHFMEHVRRNLKATYGLDALYRGGLRVRTTLDMAWQRSAERAIRTYLPSRTDP